MTGWVSFPVWLILPVKTPLPAPKSGKGSGGVLGPQPDSAWYRLAYHMGLGPFCLGTVLMCLVEFLWPDGKERGVLTSQVTSGLQFLHH